MKIIILAAVWLHNIFKNLEQKTKIEKKKYLKKLDHETRSKRDQLVDQSGL